MARRTCCGVKCVAVKCGNGGGVSCSKRMKTSSGVRCGFGGGWTTREGVEVG